MLLSQAAVDDDAGDRQAESVPPKLRDRALLLPAAGLLLTMPPLVIIFSRQTMVFGLPLLYLYLFGLWCLLILFGALLAHQLQRAVAPAVSATPGSAATTAQAPAPEDPPEGSADAR